MIEPKNYHESNKTENEFKILKLGAETEDRVFTVSYIRRKSLLFLVKGDTLYGTCACSGRPRH